jgi:sensor histidine kinase YesM
MENKSKLSVYIDSVWLAVGELIVAALTSLAFLLFGKFSYTVVTGALLGGAVTVINFLILSVAINRAINGYITERGDKEMDDEAAEEYAKQHGTAVQNAMTKSYMLRMLLMIGSLVLAMISGWFSPLATVIPLIMYRPILYVTEFIKVKAKAKRGD